MIFSLLLLTGSLVMSQTVQISGTVTGQEDGLAVPGVSVTVKGTTIGTLTGADGKYNYKTVPQKATTLVFSFIGMKTTEVAIDGKSRVDLVLQPDLVGLDEVVVTAMGISREKKSLGYAVQDISSDQIARAGNPNLTSNISGKFAGVEVRQSSGMPGAPSTILIRGARSFDGDNQPLYVVDGMPITSNADYDQKVTGSYSSSRSLDIDPNNIESIDVLKGQAAAALYGMRASNGVIVITTKSGKSASKGVPTVNITSSYTMDKVAVLPDVQQTWAQGYYEDFYPAYSYSWGPKIAIYLTSQLMVVTARVNSGKWFDPYKGLWVNPVAYNNAKNFFKKGRTFYNGVNVSNSTALGSYMIGVSSTNQDAIVANSGMKRYTANASGTVNLGDKWKAGFSGNYSDVNLTETSFR